MESWDANIRLIYKRAALVFNEAIVMFYVITHCRF